MFNLEPNEEQPIFSSSSEAGKFFTLFFCFAEKEGVSLFSVKSCDDMLHMGIFKI